MRLLNDRFALIATQNITVGDELTHDDNIGIEDPRTTTPCVSNITCLGRGYNATKYAMETRKALTDKAGLSLGLF